MGANIGPSSAEGALALSLEDGTRLAERAAGRKRQATARAADVR